MVTQGLVFADSHPPEWHEDMLKTLAKFTIPTDPARLQRLANLVAQLDLGETGQTDSRAA